jgi:hypothetical protein
VHLVGFIIRICHDARSHERQILPGCQSHCNMELGRLIRSLLNKEEGCLCGLLYSAQHIQSGLLNFMGLEDSLLYPHEPNRWILI